MELMQKKRRAGWKEPIRRELKPAGGPITRDTVDLKICKEGKGGGHGWLFPEKGRKEGS